MKFNENLNKLQESIFSQITKMAINHKAINLAQGFPDFDGPEWVKKFAIQAIDDVSLNVNQYAPSMGNKNLREIVSKNYADLYNLNFDPENEVLITNGATEAIYCTIQALINPNDEVIIFEPFYDSYYASLQMANANIKISTLKTPDFKINFQELESLVSDKTKLMILNNPQNPTGRVFTDEELKQLVIFAQKHQFYILSDEVYEFLTFGSQHIPLASYSEIKERVITISSIGKTLSFTGWKVGWVVANSDIVNAIHKVHQFNCFCVAHPLQYAAAKSLEKIQEYLPEFRDQYWARKDILSKGLIENGFEIYNSEGSYFILAKVPVNLTDIEFCKKLIQENKVAAIPVSAFYQNSDEGKKLVRFCFAKKEATLKQALDNLNSIRGVI